MSEENEIWSKWESQVVNGAFPLRRYLGQSDHSVVFLTEDRSSNSVDAVIKLVPADPVRAEAQLAQWRMIAGLSHPHLLRLIDMGSCTLGGHPFLFVVMEYAEQNLSQILPQRPLSFDEVNQLLPPALSALGYLHAAGLVHGQLKPPNFLVVKDTLKLSSDGIRRAGESAPAFAKPSPYDAPEAKAGKVFAAGDAWSFGATLIEALTQKPPAADPNAPRVALPAAVPADFAANLSSCLSRNPLERPTFAAFDPQFGGVRTAPAAPKPAPAAAASHLAHRNTPQRWIIPAIALGLLALVIMWASGHRQPPAAAALAPSNPRPAAPLPASAPAAALTPLPAPGTVLHQEIPEISRTARQSIRGRIKVLVQVTVDRAGKVSAATLQSRGSKYFSRLSAEAAQKWTFAPTEAHAPRQRLLQFEFSRDGVTATALNAGR